MKVIEVLIPVSSDEELALACLEKMAISARRRMGVTLTVGLSTRTQRWIDAFKNCESRFNGLVRVICHEERLWTEANEKALFQLVEPSEDKVCMVVPSWVIPESFDPFGDALAVYSHISSQHKEHVLMAVPLADTEVFYPQQMYFMNTESENFFRNPADGTLDERVLVFHSQSIASLSTVERPYTKFGLSSPWVSWSCRKKLFAVARFA